MRITGVGNYCTHKCTFIIHTALHVPRHTKIQDFSQQGGTLSMETEEFPNQDNHRAHISCSSIFISLL